MATGTRALEAPTATPPPDSTGRGRPIVLVLLALVVLGGTAWWVVDRQTSIDVVVTGTSPGAGITIEAEYRPVLPTTITGASVSTDLGTDDGATLYDNSTDSDAPPASVAVRAGRSVSVYATVVPDCTVSAPSDRIVVTLQTTNGPRRFDAHTDGLGQAMRRLCVGAPEFSLSQVSRDADVVRATYLTTPVAHPVTLSVRGRVYEAEPIRIEPSAGQVAWTVTTEDGCEAAQRPVVALASWRGGRQTLRLDPPGTEVC